MSRGNFVLAWGILFCLAANIQAAEPAHCQGVYTDLHAKAGAGGTYEVKFNYLASLSNALEGVIEIYYDLLVDAGLNNEEGLNFIEEAEQWLVDANVEIANGRGYLAAANGAKNSGKGAADVGNYTIAHNWWDTCNQQLDLADFCIEEAESILVEPEGYIFGVFSDINDFLEEHRQQE